MANKTVTEFLRNLQGGEYVCPDCGGTNMGSPTETDDIFILDIIHEDDCSAVNRPLGFIVETLEI